MSHQHSGDEGSVDLSICMFLFVSFPWPFILYVCVETIGWCPPFFQSPSMFLFEMGSLTDLELSNRLVLLATEPQGSFCLYTPSTGCHVGAGDQGQVLMCRRQGLDWVPNAWPSSAYRFKPGASRSSSKIRPFTLILKAPHWVRAACLLGCSTRLPWEDCCLSTRQLFLTSPQYKCTEVPLFPFHLGISLVPVYPECSPHSCLVTVFS